MAGCRRAAALTPTGRIPAESSTPTQSGWDVLPALFVYEFQSAGRQSNLATGVSEVHFRPIAAVCQKTATDVSCPAQTIFASHMSIRSVERVTNVHRDTIMRLLVLAGERCGRLMESKFQNLDVREVEVDEIWGFVGKKEGHKTAYDEQFAEIGDAYCFVAMERNTKLVITHYLGKRTTPSTDHFIAKLAHATSGQRYQLTSDGFKAYVKAVKTYLPGRVDFAQLVKVYSSPREGEQRYSPGEVVDAVPVKIMGNPDKKRICTSHIERQNLSIRMGMRRMTRLTNAFSKKWGNLEAAYNLWFAYYNFCRRHKTLQVTPAMGAGLTERIWSVADLLTV